MASASGTIIMFGGFVDYGPPPAQAYWANDTWSWDGYQWNQAPQTNAPAAREDAGMAGDGSGLNVILYGGDQSGSRNYGDTWDLKSDPSQLQYHGGNVQITPTVHLIFWEPPGHQPTDPNFNTLVVQFFQDASAANPYYGLLSQYYQISPNLQYITSTFSYGGSWTDTRPFTNSHDYVPCSLSGGSCVGDGEIQYEAGYAAAINNWTQNQSNLFLIFVGPGPFICAPGNMFISNNCSSNPNGLCAYHAARFPDFSLIYGAVAYPILQNCAVTSHDTNKQTPHDPITDSAINMGSHELFESVSDPAGQGWCDASGYRPLGGVGPNYCQDGEIGDKCGYNIGPQNPDGSDLTLNGHNYIVQREWSNRAATTTDSYGTSRCTLS